MRERIHTKSLRHWLPAIAIASLFVRAVFAQAGPPFNTTVPSQIMDQFRNNRILWTTNVFVYANSLVRDSRRDRVRLERGGDAPGEERTSRLGRRR